MSITSKKNFTLKKADIATQRSIAIGFKKVVFYHEAAADETSIGLGALNMPASLSGVGFTNPSTQELLALNIYFYRDNLTLVSSARGILQAGLSYIISGNSINFTDDFGGTLDGEIFTGILDPVAKTGAQIVDASPLISTGELPANETDYVVGQPFEANKYPSTQVGAVMVFLDGVLQFRNTGNATAAPGEDGNYQEVAVTGGLSTLIRFNDVDTVNDRSVIVVSTTLIAERPTDSMMATVERLQGQIDSVIATTAVLAGVPESDFQVAPNNVDLKQFGDRVLDLEQTIYSGTYTPSITDVAQVNIASASVTGPFHYTRIDNIVHVTGNIAIDPTAGAPTETKIYIALPIARVNFGFIYEANGVGSHRVTATDIRPVRITAHVGFQVVECLFAAAGTTSVQTTFSFSYQLT